jgi:hypothetical protein
MVSKMTRQEQIIEILTYWKDIVEKEYEDLNHEEQLAHLQDEGYDLEEIVEACLQMQ